MPLVDVATAKPQLRVPLADTSRDADIARMLAASEEQATSFLGRNVYATPEELAAAVAAAPAALTAATAAYNAAMAAAVLVVSEAERTLQQSLATSTYRAAQDAYMRTMAGIVVTESVRVAILLTTASQWEHLGDEDQIQGVPPAARTFLWPLRIGIGV